MHRDPTSEAAERNEGLSCVGCLWRYWDPDAMRSHCTHRKWIAAEKLRPQTGGVNSMRRCSWFEEIVTTGVFHMRKDRQ